MTSDTQQSDYPVGTPIPLNVTIANIGSGTYAYFLCGLNAQASADTASTNVRVWDSIFGIFVPLACAGNQMLAPDESVTDQLVWKQNTNAGGAAPQGGYAVNFSSGRLSGVDPPVTAIPTLYVTIGTAP